MRALSAFQSGFMPGGEVRDIKAIKTTGNKTIFAVARNSETILFYQAKQ
jgi:hypothetical protein